ncbi:transposase zinc-binding domain-containing protein [Archangium gephyra]|uniref:Transposon-related function n=1 Tax=Archangium gephyra TaxID=48 RepID=A0AAC8THK9_9BACT|nr:transposase zinc-binding domain-containing protein [Archangium gephyra]AKJ06223.1 Transposon-related function [Archangium gephyra]
MLYEAVRENLATLLAEASEVGRGLPRYVEGDFARYLECGVLAHGFARVRCESCKDELLVAFSCKGRGVCPSCGAKRAHVTAMHLVEQVLPHVLFRQWTLSFPHRVRWVLLKDVGLLSDVLTVQVAAVKDVGGDLLMQCFGGNPDPGHNTAMIQLEDGLADIKALEAKNCAPDHPMSEL